MKKIFQFNSLDPSKTRNDIRVHKANHSLRAFVEHEHRDAKSTKKIVTRNAVLYSEPL